MKNFETVWGRAGELVALSVLSGVLTVGTGCGSPTPITPPPAMNDAGEEPDGGHMESPDLSVVELPDGGGPAPMPPVLVSAMARQAGRFGDDVRIDLVGRDVDGDASSLDVTFLDVDGAELSLYDLDADGVLDSGNALVPLAAPITGVSDAPAYVSFARLRGAHPELATVRVVLVDALDARSAALDATVSVQPVLALDALCDSVFVDNRCEDGLGCRGAVPAVCTAGVAPSIVRAVYVTHPAGAQVLVEGTDADDDVSQIDIAFFDGTGTPIPLDLDADGTPEATSFAADARDTSSRGTFFYRFAASAYFAGAVPRVSVLARDRGGRTSEPVFADLTAPAARSVGETCDARGFDSCRVSVCSPGVVGATNRCVEVDAARRTACTEALTVDVTSGAGMVRGELHEPSLWDAPAGCSSGDPTARPEAAVRFVLAAPASRVVLSTNNAYTNFDSTLYAFAGCAGAPIVAWCADDRPTEERSLLATLELGALPAGEYFVVVD